MDNDRTEIIYNIHDNPAAGKRILYAFQHIFAMFAGNITVPMMVVGVAGLTGVESTKLIQSAMLMAGIATLIQVVGVGPVGSRLPVVMGTSNAFLTAVVTTVSTYGIAACLTASFIGGLFEAFLGSFLDKLKSLFTPLVSGIVVMTIGLTLIPAGIKQAAGSKTAVGMGAPINLILSSIVILTVILCHCSKNKMIKSSSIFIGVLVGCVVAALAGVIDPTRVGEAGWIGMPGFMSYKPDFQWPAIITMLFMFIATTVETVGDISALTVMAEDRQPTPEESKGAILADGIGSALAAIFNAFPNTSYTQNIGVVNLTGVFSRSVVSLGAVILVLLSFFPKLAALILCIPEPVLGGAVLITFVMVFLSGITLMTQEPMNSRNLLIAAVSIGIGVGLNLVPDATAGLSAGAAACMTSGVIPASILAIAMNQLIPGKRGLKE